jgi:hypothetical protein
MSTTTKTPALDAPAEPAVPATWGEVHAHERIMRYRHSGAGPAVLLLGADVQGHSGDLWPELPALLQSHFRVVIPQLPSDIDEVARSLECLLDGVGATGIGLIAGGPYCQPAMDLATGGGEFVKRLVLVGLDNTAELKVPGAAANSAAVPILVLSRRLSVAKAMARALPFLRGIVAR